MSTPAPRDGTLRRPRRDDEFVSALDATFGTSGWKLFSLGSNGGLNAVALQGDGKIVGAGYYWNTISSQNNIAVIRYLSSGAADTAFNGTGKVVTEVESGQGSVASALALTGSSIIVAGTASVGTASLTDDFVVARYCQ